MDGEPQSWEEDCSLIMKGLECHTEELPLIVKSLDSTQAFLSEELPLLS